MPGMPHRHAWSISLKRGMAWRTAGFRNQTRMSRLPRCGDPFCRPGWLPARMLGLQTNTIFMSGRSLTKCKRFVLSNHAPNGCLVNEYQKTNTKLRHDQRAVMLRSTGCWLALSPSRPRPFHSANRALVTSDIRLLHRMSRSLPSAARLRRCAPTSIHYALLSVLRSTFPLAARRPKADFIDQKRCPRAAGAAIKKRSILDNPCGPRRRPPT